MTTSEPSHQKLGTITLLRIFVPFAFGYFLSYLYRTVNAVISPDLVRDIGLDATSLGLLTSTYFLTFALFQVPLGVLLDKFGPRRTEAALLVFAGAGAAIFGLAESETGLLIGRALIGFGVSACLMAAFKAFVDWFPADKLPLTNGIQMASGGLGALVATAPVQAALEITDWRGVFLFLAGATFLVALSVFLLVPEKPKETDSSSLASQLDGLKGIFKSRLFWKIAPLTVASQSSFIAVQSLWVGPWLRDVAHLERGAAAGILLVAAAGMVAGFLGMGALTVRLGKIGIRPMTVVVVSLSIFVLAQLTIIAEWTSMLAIQWGVFGFFGSTGIITYAALSQQFPPHLAGRLNTSLNLLVFIASFALQWSIGAVIDLWPQTAQGGYNPTGFKAAFSALVAAQILAIAWYLLPKGKRL